MRLESSVVVRKSPEDVWNFLEAVSNLPKWDRGVATVRLTSPGAPVIGTEFDTLPHPRRPGDGLEWDGCRTELRNGMRPTGTPQYS